MNSKNFCGLSIVMLIFGIIIGGVSAITGDGLGVLLSGISLFLFLQFCAAVLDNLEKLPSRIKAEFDGTKPLVPESEEGQTNFYELPKESYIPDCNAPARKRAVEAVKNSGFTSTEKVKTKEGYSIGFDSNNKLVAIVDPAGAYYVFSPEQLKNFGIKIDTTNDGAVNCMEVLIRTKQDEIHIVTLDGPSSCYKTVGEARGEADQIIRLLNKIKA